MVTRIVLELGCNHQGQVDVAKAMIDDAVRLGVYGVKVQKRCPEVIPEELKYKPRDLENSFGETYYEHRKALELSVSSVVELREYAEARGLAFMVSVFDMPSAREMVEQAKVRFIKLPSQLLLDYDLNTYLMLVRRSYKLTLLHSTGMHTDQEVLACPFLNRFDVTYYCRSIYPCAFDQLDLGSARCQFDALLDADSRGYSSHDVGGEAIPWFVLMGARWVECHYTLDKKMKGSDHKTVSRDYDDMARIIADVYAVEARYNDTALMSKSECANADFYRRRS